MKKKEECAKESQYFKEKFDYPMGLLGSRYGIDCLYIGDGLLPDIGICSMYLASDIREEHEKNLKGTIGKDMLGYSPDFARAIFKIDGAIIEGAQFNSVLLTPKQLEIIAKNNNLKFKIDHSRIIYEIIAVNEPDLKDLENRLV